jgi:hypothetical protein
MTRSHSPSSLAGGIPAGGAGFWRGSAAGVSGRRWRTGGALEVRAGPGGLEPGRLRALASSAGGGLLEPLFFALPLC